MHNLCNIRPQVYVNFFNFLVNLVAPVCVLSILNSLIYRELRRNQSAGAAGLRRNMSGGRQGSVPDARAVRITRSATVIVCVFLGCHVPRFIPNVVELFIPLPPVCTSYLHGPPICHRPFLILKCWYS